MKILKELNLLFLEDNEVFAENTISFLKHYFKEVYHASDIKSSLAIFSDNQIDVIISDIKVKDGNGLDFIQKIRAKDQNIPIVVLSAHKDENFLFKAIPLHILSYELKPLNYDKFLNLLRKIEDKFLSKQAIEINKNISYDYAQRSLIVDDEFVRLTKKEMRLVELMIKNMENVVSKEAISTFVWQEEQMSDSALKNLIFRLRKKANADFIITVQDVGYKLNI